METTVQMVALDRFRRLLGVKARPEDHPKVWQGLLASTWDELNDLRDEEADNA